jgi:hypothetical protein
MLPLDQDLKADIKHLDLKGKRDALITVQFSLFICY